MQETKLAHGILHQQADQIEKVLSSLAVPVKIQGGQIGQEWVRYHLAPLSETSQSGVRQMANLVAEAMGVYHVRVSESDQGIALELPLPTTQNIPLLPLLLEHGAALTAILGLNVNGKHFRLNFRDPRNWHLIVSGSADTGKSELLRTTILSLATSSSQSQLKFIGIDLEGREQMVIDALPHGLGELATDFEQALTLLHWVSDEMERREVYQIRYPDIVLVIDQLDQLFIRSSETSEFESAAREADEILDGVIKMGRDVGFHLLATHSEDFQDLDRDSDLRFGVGRAMARVNIDRKSEVIPGDFVFLVENEEHFVQVAWLPVSDLQELVSRISNGWRPSADRRSKGSNWT
jgi:DNA segregation ATPase FtsK/SpoIIIE-like protein